jgi:hypothetical protein
MKERILHGWNFMRVFYLLIGLAVIIESIISRQWPGIAFGGYFAAMGLFRFGCAAGTCYTAPPRRTKQDLASDIQYEDVKNHTP